MSVGEVLALLLLIGLIVWVVLLDWIIERRQERRIERHFGD